MGKLLDADMIRAEVHHIPTANKALFELLDRWNKI